MKCKLCEDRLLEYLYGELGEEDAAAMERHLDASEACRRACDGFASLLETVRGADEREPPPAMHARIMGHAKEARLRKRSFWSWMLQPAVTTAVIGAVAAGVYFATLRVKPPSPLEERRLSEESPLRKAERRAASSSFDAKGPLPAKELKRRATQGTPAEPSGAIGPIRGEGEPRESLEESEPLGLPGPAVQAVPLTEADSMDEEGVRTSKRKKSEALSAGADPGAAGGVESKAPQASNAATLPPAFSASPERKPSPPKQADLPLPIAKALEFASQGRCAEASKRVQEFSFEHPGEAACGTGWLEAARCYAKKGDEKAAREMAERALGIPVCASEARALLESLSPPAQAQQNGTRE